MVGDGDGVEGWNVAVVVVVDTTGTVEECPLALQRLHWTVIPDVEDDDGGDGRMGGMEVAEVGVERTHFEGRQISMNLQLPSWIHPSTKTDGTCWNLIPPPYDEYPQTQILLLCPS